MLHVLSHPMAEVARSPWTLSSYSKNLKNVASHITSENLSAMKLIMQSEGYLKKQTLDDLKNPHEFLRVLLGRSLISNKDTSFLSFLLKEINRNDLVKILENDDLCLDGPEPPPKNPPEDTSPPLSQMSVDDYDECDDDIMSSQNSISDEEKLQNKMKVSDSL